MARAFVLDFVGGTTEQYDQVIEKMGLGGPDPAPPPGSIFHWAAQSGDGLRVVDVWESQEIFDKFAQEQIVPFSKEVGMPEPKIQAYDVHNTLPPS